MPLRIRYLAGQQQQLLDPKSVPGNHVLLNPSVAGDIVYIRDIEQTKTQQINSVILYNTKNNTSTHIPVPMEFMHSTDGYYAGLEDLRIFWYKDRLHFVGTSTHASSRLQSEMLAGVFAKDFRSVERMNHLDFGPPPVKNVCPFIWDDKILLIDTYARAMYELSDVESDTSPTSTPTFQATPLGRLGGMSLGIFGTEGLRGTTSPVHLHGSTFGCIVHDVIYDNNSVLNTKTKLAYIHQWIEFDVVSRAITFASSPFFVVHFGIEFVSGLDYNKETNKVSLYLGVDDKTPMVVYTSIQDLRA